MALLPDNPKQQKALGAIVVAAGLAYAFYTYWYTPKVEEVAATEAHVSALTGRVQNMRLMALRGGADLEERNALYERHVMQLEELIPERQEVPQLVNIITEQARRMGVNLANLNPQPPEPGDFYRREAYSLQVIGDYHDVARFITAIASLPRIITPVDLTLAGYDGTAMGMLDFVAPVQADFRIETYVLPEQTAGPPPADIGAGG